MLDYIYRLMRDFELEHGFKPNLLYLNKHHCVYLKLSFDSDLSLQSIVNILGMEVLIEQETVHPKVSWTHCVYHAAS